MFLVMPGFQANQPPNQTSSQLGNIPSIFQIYMLISFLVQPFATRLFTQVAPPLGSGGRCGWGWNCWRHTGQRGLVDCEDSSAAQAVQRTCPQTRPAENHQAIIGSHRMVDNGGYTYIYIYIMYIYTYIYICVCMARFSERGGVPEIPSAKLTSQKHEQMISLLTLLQSLPPR